MFNLGDVFTGIFGENDYQYQMPPTLGVPPPDPEESQQDYQNRIFQQYQQQNQGYQDLIRQAMGQQMPQNVLDMSAANQAGAAQGRFNDYLGVQMNRDLQFGTEGMMRQQQGLIDQILAQGRGEGPNPAMNQLRMTTDQNARQAAAMAASQRGINPALAARLATQGAASANQQAAGQGALMSAQQQLGAQQLGGGLMGQQINQQYQMIQAREAQKQAYAQLLANQLNQQRSQDIGQAQYQGQAGLGLMGQQSNTEAMRRQAQQNYQNMINNIYSGANTTNSGVASQNAGIIPGLAAGASTALAGAATMKKAHGGMIEDPFRGAVRRKMADGGQVSLAPELQSKVAAIFGMSEGGKVGGRAEVAGDSEKNDTVPVMLSPGEIVIPRTATNSVEDAHAFLNKVIQKHQGPDFKKVMKARENYHNMAHGGEIHSCKYCNGGMV